MTVSAMEEGERLDDGADATEQRYGHSREVEGVKRDSLRDAKRDSLQESKRGSLRDTRKESFEETKRPHLRDMKKDSIHDSKRDSLRDSKRDSLIESGRDSPRINSRRESGRDSPRKDSERRNTYSKGQEGTKTPAERKRASGRSLDKNIVKKEKNLEDNEKKEGDMVETASTAAKRKALVLERRMLCGCTGLVGLAALVWLTAVCTEGWFTVHAPSPEGLYINATSRYFLYSTSGLFRLCRYARRNSSSPVQKICWLHEVFPTEDKLKAGIWVDKTIINYTRTEIFFSILSFILMVMGFLFSIYTFRNPRYMFKRLAAGIHFMSGATVMVVIEVLINSIDYERLSLNVVHPKEAYHTFGYSFYLGWIVFIFNSFASITFLVYSKKRKGDKAPTEEIALADEPTIIGR